jgi:signal transduction histidine kinase/transcriptional regulator with GAF, ATPase, and Fis domain
MEALSAAVGRRSGVTERYAVAVLLAVTAVAIHAPVHRRFGPDFDAFFLVVVAVSTWLGGLGPGLVTLAVSGFGALLTLMRTRGSLGEVAREDLLELTAYGISGMVVSLLIATMLAAQRRAERAAARTARLHSLNLALAPALSPDEVSAIIIRHAMEALQARAGAIALSAADGTRAPAVRSDGHFGDPDDPDGPLAQALRSGRPIFIESGAEWRARHANAAARGLERGSVVAVPFVAEGVATGGLELEFEHDRRIPLEDRNFILTLAGHGALALERARLYQAERAARRHAEDTWEQMAFLAEVSEVLASTLDYRVTLSAAARLAVPRLGDWCAVDVVDADGRLRRLAIAHTDPAKVDAVWAMSHRYAEAAEDPVPQVIRTAKPQLIPEIPDEMLRRFARDPEHLEALRAFGLRSLLIVPLSARGRTLGAITFVLAESGRRYGPGDLLLGELLARRAAIAVDNARLYHEADQALQENAGTLALLDTVFRGAPIGLAFVDDGLRFVRVNEALAAMNRTPVEDHLGRTLKDVLGAGADVVVPLFEEVLRTGRPVLDQEIVAPPRSPQESERILLASYYPVRAPDGRTAWVGCIVSDVTEERRASALLVQAERMQAVARVAGGVAHEVNNMMTVITGFSGFLEGSLPAHDPRLGDVAEIRRAADRAAGITRQLLAYSRQQVLQPTPLDLNALVRRNLPVLARLLGDGVRLTLREDPDLAQVRADASQLEQVLVNLALNARDAMEGQGTLTVVTDTAVVGEDQRQHSPGPRMAPGRYARLTVTDTGEGMDAVTRDRVFEPFFTTKPSGQGSGLGLATVYGIVKQSGGFIWVASEPGQGTSFRIYLPEFTGTVTELPAAAPPVSPRGAETILIVEDESAVRRMAARALAGQGYTILEAENGAEALAVLARTAGPVDLVLTDVVMPILNGRELGERLAADRPELRVLFMSGYTDDDVVRRGLLRPGVPFLQKPFMPADLSRKVRAVLDSR